jgi:DNA-binding transcriptional regulator LsrR (DeoR family)
MTPPDRLGALYAAARLYYVDERPQAEIARRLGLSQPTVSRLLRQAREEGIVQIEIRPMASDPSLAARLQAALGVRRAVVAPSGPAADRRATLIGPALDELAALGLEGGDVLALGWGRTVSEIVEGRLPSLAGVALVPTVGGLNEADRSFHANEIVRRAAERSGAVAHLLHAPAVPSAALRRSLAGDRTIAHVLSLWDRLDAALVGIGAPAAAAHGHGPGHVRTPEALAALATAAGDVTSRYFDLEGRAVHYPGEQRLLAVTREQLRLAGTVIGVAAGEAKAAAIAGVARGGLIDVLVTDANTAAAALAIAEASPRATPRRRARE